jgi:hypothetical protein
MAYGSARLASWLVFRYRPLFPEVSSPVESVCQSFSAVRHAGLLWLAEDLLDRDLRYVLQFRLGPGERAQLLLELASVYEDILDLDAARALLDQASRILERARNPPQAAVTRNLRRSALPRLLIGERLERAADELQETTGPRYDSNILAGLENARAWLEHAQGKSASAIDRLVSLIDVEFGPDGLPRPMVVAPWTATESILTLASLTSGAGGGRVGRSAANLLRHVTTEPTYDRLLLRPIASELAVASLPVAGRGQIASLAARLRDRSTLSARARRLLKEVATALCAGAT